MDHDKAFSLYRVIAKTSETELLRDLLRYAVQYAHICACWNRAESEEPERKDQMRTAAHNAFIDSCNILSRAMKRAEENDDWRLELGTDRKQIGDFACYLHCFVALDAR